MNDDGDNIVLETNLGIYMMMSLTNPRSCDSQTNNNHSLSDNDKYSRGCKVPVANSREGEKVTILIKCYDREYSMDLHNEKSSNKIQASSSLLLN